MSAFLGKIHFWLFNKIRYAEEIEIKIIQWAENENALNASRWKSEIESKFGTPVSGEPLESIIDTSNIHGWLQDKITRVESRQAAWITNIITTNLDYKEKLVDIFATDGAEKGAQAKENYDINTPMDIYKVLNDFVLEGMPCDAVDKTVENTESLFQWISTACLHRNHWEKVGGNIKIFYDLRKAWIESFVNSLDSRFTFEVAYEGESRRNTIKNKR